MRIRAGVFSERHTERRYLTTVFQVVYVPLREVWSENDFRRIFRAGYALLTKIRKEK